VSPSGSSDQNQINQALLGGGTVYLNPGVYDIDGQIRIGSNTILTGSQDAVLRVSCPNGRWFSNSVGVINGNGNNIEISEFSFDGNCENLPFDYSHTSADTAHDCESLIHLIGNSNSFMSNVSIHDMKLYDAYSDGITLRYCDHAECYNNIISNCEHEGIFYSRITNSQIYGNSIAGITSDNLRLDNSVNCKVYSNVLFSYSGDHAQTYEHGENGLQVGDGGSSHGYNAEDNSISTSNIEVYGNTFADNGLQAILLDSAALASSANVFIHDNKFLNATELKTSGISFELANGTMPTFQQSQNIFSSIFDILKQDFSFQYLNTQVPINASVSVTDYNNTYNPHSLVYVDGVGLSGVKYEYNGLTTTHYYQPADLWQGNIPNTGNCLYIQGQFDKSKLTVTCFTPSGYSKIANFNITTVNDDSNQILSPELWAFIGTLSILGISIYRNFRRVIAKW